MSAIELTGPAIPEELAPNIDGYGANIDHGRRVVSWRIHHPDGTLIFRNEVAWAWLNVTEAHAFAGDMLGVRASRRITESGPVEPFTDTARRRLEEVILPAVARYGFSRWWSELHVAKINPDAGQAAALDAHRIARWHDDRLELHALYAAGKVDVIPMPADMSLTRSDAYANRKPVVESVGLGERISMTDVLAELRLDGETIGWLDPRGYPIPTGEELREHWTPRP